MKKLFDKITDWLLFEFIARFHWEGLRYLITKKHYSVTAEDVVEIVKLMNEERLIGISWRSAHLSSYLVAIGHFLLTGKWVKCAHVFTNIEYEFDRDANLLITEATGQGVKNSRFWEVLNCDRVMLFKVRGMTEEESALYSAYVRDEVGKKYDKFYRFKPDDNLTSCTELPFRALQKVNSKFTVNLEALLAKHKKLTPAMYLESYDLVWVGTWGE